MKILISFLMLVAVFSSPLSSQTSLLGKISDGQTGEELIASNVSFYKDGVFMTGIATDFEGNYNINLDPGTYDVEVSYIGYGTVKTNGVLVKAGQANRLDVALGGPSGNQQRVLLNNRRQRAPKKTGLEFHSPKEEGLIREILGNTPQLLNRL